MSTEALEGWKALEAIRRRTPARLFVGRAGAAYRTQTQLELRAAHAAAGDAVHAEMKLERDLTREILERFSLFEVQTAARDKAEYIRIPQLGRRFSAEAAEQIAARCHKGADLQIAIADGLSVTAVRAQVPALLPLLVAEAESRGWRVGQPFVIRYGRVAIMNSIGELLQPKIVVLLIGERPGLATAESLSAYLAFRPKQGDSDADRNLISNIHLRGVPPQQAAPRIMNFAGTLMREGRSGAEVKEEVSVNACEAKYQGTSSLAPSTGK